MKVAVKKVQVGGSSRSEGSHVWIEARVNPSALIPLTSKLTRWLSQNPDRQIEFHYQGLTLTVTESDRLRNIYQQITALG